MTVSTTTRENGKKALFTVVTKEKNVEVIERNIYRVAKKGDKKVGGGRSPEETYKWIVFQFVGSILQNRSTVKEGLAEVKAKNVGRKNEFYTQIRDQLEETYQYLIKPFDVSEGVVECPKCKSKKTFSVQRQTRGGDEPMTTFSVCTDCGKDFVYSG